MQESIVIRKGKIEDLEQVLELIRELAVYEKAPDEVENTVEQMKMDGFGNQPVFEFFVAELPDPKIVGLALYFYSYSTWKGKCVYLEDLIVTQAYRRKGIGRLLMDKVIDHARAVDARRVAWQVLDWNEPAIKFYRDALNANLDGEWINVKLTREQIQHDQPGTSSPGS